MTGTTSSCTYYCSLNLFVCFCGKNTRFLAKIVIPWCCCPQNILADLDHHFEDEKAALLATLHGTLDKLDQEKQRQLMLARMRREQRRLQREEKLDTAAVLMNMAKDQEKAWQDK